MSEKETYYVVTGHLRASISPECISAARELMDSIRALTNDEPALHVAICVLGAGLAAEIPLKDIAL